MEDFRPKEISVGQLKNLMKDLKYTSAINKFSQDKFDVSSNFINALKSRQRSIEDAVKCCLVTDNSDDPFILKGRETLLQGSINVSNFLPQTLDFIPKTLASCYRYKVESSNIDKVRLYNFSRGLNAKKHIASNLCDVHFNLVLKGDNIDKSNFNLSNTTLKASTDSIYKVGVIQPNINLFSDKIRIRNTINKNINLDSFEGVDLKDLITCISESKKSLINSLRIHLNFIARDNIPGAFKYNETYIKSYTLNNERIDTLGVKEWYQGVGFWDFIKNYKGSNGTCYKVSTEGTYENKTLLVDIAKNLGLQVFPSELLGYLEAYKEAEEEGLLDEFFDSYGGTLHESLGLDGLEVTYHPKSDDVILKNDLHSKTYSHSDVEVLEQLEDFIVNINKISFYSTNIDSYIKSNISDKTKIQELLDKFESMLLLYCEDCYSTSQPVIVEKKSALFPNDSDTEYAIISISTHEPSASLISTLKAQNFSKKRVHVCDYNKLKSALLINDDIESTLSKYKTTI